MNGKKIFIQYLIFIAAEIILMGIIVILGYKISKLNSDKVKGTQYITKINMNGLIFDSSRRLKYFYEPKPNQTIVWTSNWLGHDIKYAINSDTLNESKEYTIPKTNNTFRIIALGDSFTFGAYVDPQFNYTEVLENMLNSRVNCNNIQKFEVMNLGVSAYDIEYTVERFIKRGLKYDPDLVIWLVLEPNFNKINEYSKPIVDNLKDKGIPHEINIEGKIISLDQKLAKESVQNDYSMEYINDYQKKALFNLYEYYQGKLILFSFPLRQKEVGKIIEEFIAKSNNYSFYDNLFNYWDDKQYQLQDGHPNISGHKKIAIEMFNYLTKSTFKNCQIK